MGRLRARLAKSSVDARVQSHVASAEAQVQAALRICRRARMSHEIETGRALRVERDLGRALAALSGVGRLRSILDVEDPDLMPERDRERIWREGLLRDREESEVVEAEAPGRDLRPEPEVNDD